MTSVAAVSPVLFGGLRSLKVAMAQNLFCWYYAEGKVIPRRPGF